MSISLQKQLSHQKWDDHLNSQHRVYLMCPPDHYGISYEINPWMDRTKQPDLDLAKEQWNSLVSNLRESGATVEILPPIPSLPDKVFTADIGFIDQHRFIMSRFRYPQRQPETVHGADWFRDRTYEVVEPSLGAEESLESSDISFCSLNDSRAIVTPAAWSRRSCELIQKLVPEPLVLELDEAMTSCANSVVVGKTVIMPSCPLRVGRILERWGFMICISPVIEFLKAGGAVHCLTLDLHGPLYKQVQGVHSSGTKHGEEIHAIEDGVE